MLKAGCATLQSGRFLLRTDRELNAQYPDFPPGNPYEWSGFLKIIVLDVRTHTSKGCGDTNLRNRSLTMKDTAVAISNLKSQWPTLHDLDRAQAIDMIHKAGASVRSLARELGCSESLLRYLLEARRAPAADQLLARQGAISIRELVHRGRAAGASRKEKLADDLNRMRTRDAVKGSKTICDWLRSEGIPGSYGEQVVGEARSGLEAARQEKNLPYNRALPTTPLAQIILRCRPAEPEPEGADRIAWLGRWLARWAFYSMPDHWVRYQAIELALEKQRSSIYGFSPRKPR
jgi:lambda repressor-like predicted transcriptional regulator